MMMRAIVVVLAGSFLTVTTARAQSLAAELDLTAGYSTEENVTAAATQFRVFGEGPAAVRFYGEAAWGKQFNGTTDAFGAAYPYFGDVQAMEVYGERIFKPGASLAAVRVGRYRTPFGISGRGDHSYSGFLRAPLIRYDGYWALSNNFLEQGVDAIVGIPQLYVEASVGAPGDVGKVSRRSGVDTVIRVQGYRGPLIVGVSYMRSRPYMARTVEQARLGFTGIDVRWMLAGIEARGEWLSGRPIDGTNTSGWYADAILHRPGMGPVTAVFRAEQLDWTGLIRSDDAQGRRQTAGARIRLTNAIAVHVNVIHQDGYLAKEHRSSVDLATTYAIRLH